MAKRDPDTGGGPVARADAPMCREWQRRCLGCKVMTALDFVFDDDAD